MKPHAQELVTGDRIPTREELSEVIGLLIPQHQLPFETTLESLQSESRSEAEELELWTDADGDGRPGAVISAQENRRPSGRPGRV
jgi:hypothetical protein